MTLSPFYGSIEALKLSGRALEQSHVIGDFVLDLHSGTLRRSGILVPLRPKIFELLAFFVQNAGRLLTKDELFDAVWPNATVTEDSITQSIRTLRMVLNDDEQTIVRTLPRRGYMFQPPAARVLEEVRPVEQSVTAKAAIAEPMVAVLPFRLKVGNEQMASLFEGVVEEITNALSYFKTIAVLARYSAAALARDPDGDIRSAAERIGVDYVVEGTVEDAGALLDVRIALSETKSGRRLWSQTFSFQIEGVFDFQQTVARRVVTELANTIESAAMRRMPPAPASNIEAYGNLLRGIALLRSYGETVNVQARQHLQRAIELDPTSGLAFAYLALAEVIIGGYGSSPPAVIAQARDNALHGILLSPDEARCHRILALILLYARDFTAAEHHLMRSLDLNPYDADTLEQMGFLQSMRGRAEQGLELMDRAVQLNPMHPAWYHFDRGDALLCLGRYREAAMSYECLPRKDAYHLARLSAAYALDGDLIAATDRRIRAQALDPEITTEDISADVAFERADAFAMLWRGLELAGWGRPST